VCEKEPQLANKRVCPKCRYQKSKDTKAKWLQNLSAEVKEKNRIYHNNYFKKYYKANKKAITIQRKDYRTKNKVRVSAMNRITKLSDPDRYAEIQRQSYQKNKHKYARPGYLRKYRKDNHEVLIIRQYLLRQLNISIPLTEIRSNIKMYDNMRSTLKVRI